ncbi:MAG: Wzz/FepE/Etk N-terminal domain-containing protein [Flavobacteriaceae bacterium]|jgi:uncharacterized protein involved in exopolysaccharide biosynthesis
MNTPSKEVREDEIDLVELLKKVFASRRWIIRFTAAAFFVGIILAILAPVRFTAGTSFVPQTSSDQPSSSLSGLASLAGINLTGLTGSGSEIPPMLYPNIVKSIPYKRALLETTVGSNNQTLREYTLALGGGTNVLGTIKKYTIGLPGLLLNSKEQDTFNASQTLFKITEEDNNLFEFLNNSLSVEVNEKEGYVSLSFESDDRNIAAEAAQAATDLLQERVIKYKNQSALETLKFVQQQHDAKKIEFETLQDSIARFKDQNLNIASSLYQNKLTRLEANFSIVSSVFQELSGQLEQAKLQVSKDTPIFTVIEPVNIPLERSKPKRTLMVLIWAFLGFVLSTGWVLARDVFFQIKQEITNS